MVTVETVAAQIRDMAGQVTDPMVRLRLHALANAAEAQEAEVETARDRALTAEHQLLMHRCGSMVA